MRTANTPSRPAEMDAGEWLGGIGFVTLIAGALAPGLLPFVVLLAVFTLPLLAVPVIAALLAAPFLGIWLIVSRLRARRASRRPGAPLASPAIDVRGGR